MEKGDVHAAEKAFARAAHADPANRVYYIDQQIAREHGVTDLVQDADKARLLGHPEIAREKLAEALRLDPHNSVVAQHIDDLASLSGATAAVEDATIALAPPIEMAPDPGLHSFHLKGSSQDLIHQVFLAYGVSPVVDDTVPTKPTRFDTDDVNFAQAARLITLATESFMVPLDPRRVLVARDTKQNHTEFDRMALETLQLPGLNDTEMTDIGNLARNVLGIQTTAVQQSSGSITLRAPMANLVAANRTLADLLQGKSEILLEVRMFQVAKTRTRNIGVQTPSSLTLFNVPSELNNIIQQNQSLVQQIISSGLANAGDYAAIAAILIASGQVSGSILGQPFALFGGGLTESGVSSTGITANLSLNSSDTRSLDQVQLRLEDHEQGTIRSGTRYPIETSNYSSISGSTPNIPGLTSAGLSSTLAGLGVNLNSLASQAIPQVQYEDLGLTLTITPSVENTGLVALKFDLKLTGLQGSSLNGLPVLTNEVYTANVVVNSGASAMLMSNLSRQQSNAVTGLPGLSELPGFQSTTNSQVELNVSNLVILVTPHVIRRRHVEQAGPLIPMPHGPG